ncbi:MAG TPA: YciI family protein [Gaiellaceae bacterium]
MRLDVAAGDEFSPVFQSLLARVRSKVSGRRGGRERSREMPRYLISFDDGAMDHIPDEEGPAVGDAAHAVIREAQNAGVWVFAGGVYPHDEVSPSVVAPDGTVTDGAENKAYIAGVTIIDVPSREEALQWAAKIASACRCAQEVREFGADPAVGN